MRFLIILIFVLLPNISYAQDINRFTERNPPATSDLMGGQTELDVGQRQAESKRNNEAGFVGERQVRGLFWNTGVVSLIRTYIAELKLENDPNFNIHEHLDEFMDGITANHIPWFTRRADSYAEGIMLREALLDRLAAYEGAQAAGWKGMVAVMFVRTIEILPIALFISLVFFIIYRQRRTKNLAET